MAFFKPARVFIVACLLFFATPAIATTRFDKAPGSCKIIGDADVYGPGIRYGYYLQWAAIMLATWMAPEQAKNARIATNVITIAVFANTFRGAREGSLVAAEWWIVLWLTFFLSLHNFPADLKRASGSGGVMLMLWSMITAAQPWLYFKGLDIGHKPNCVVKVFFFTGINVYNHVWRTIWKVGSGFECLTGFYFFVLGGAIIVRELFGQGERSGLDNDISTWTAGRKVLMTFAQLITGITSIVQVEMTIRVNRIEFSSTTLLSSGQLIPLLIGCLTVVAACGHGPKSLVKWLRGLSA
ncbi:hypothetical protein GP486_007172 [Trichoglossum hirsutum]|uniref:Uncharacterized protein n=1 Tax=Trichoglossum hirsutum TaxID=265104 RepID=A0A9P8I6W3_9PEZI|nr:hypothetical protein GP486_007172 [Trichoglossum hirsutum]